MSQCAETVTEVTPAQALSILEPYFTAMQELFAAAGLTEVQRTRLSITSSMHDSPRHFAGTRDDGRLIMLAPQMVELPEPTVVGIIGHEFGHAADFLYPGEFVLGPERVAVRRQRNGLENDDRWITWLKDWEKRDDDVVEFVADAMAERVTGRRIGYTGPCKLQAFGLGAPRPKGLR
jgi:hypothetical protein